MAIHYRASQQEAAALADQLNNARHGDSALDDGRGRSADGRGTGAAGCWRSQALRPTWTHCFNNASTYYATPVGHIALRDAGRRSSAAICGRRCFWCSGSRAASEGERWQHCQHHRHPHRATDAGLRRLQRRCAGWCGLTCAGPHLAPENWVNGGGVGPDRPWADDGQIASPERERILSQSRSKREGGVGADCRGREVHLICDADFVTGHTINVDGGCNIAL